MFNVEKSGFVRGQYVGYGGGTVWKIRKGVGFWIAHDQNNKLPHLTSDTLKGISMILTAMDTKIKTNYQPKTGALCGCIPGIQRDNCAQCEGTGQIIDFAKIRAKNVKTNPAAMRKITQDDMNSAARGLKMISMPADELKQLIADGKASPNFAGKVIGAAAKQILAAKSRVGLLPIFRGGAKLEMRHIKAKRNPAPKSGALKYGRIPLSDNHQFVWISGNDGEISGHIELPNGAVMSKTYGFWRTNDAQKAANLAEGLFLPHQSAYKKNPDIHVDINSHNARASRNVKTNPSRIKYDKKRRKPGKFFYCVMHKTGKGGNWGSLAFFPDTEKGKTFAIDYAKRMKKINPSHWFVVTRKVK